VILWIGINSMMSNGYSFKQVIKFPLLLLFFQCCYYFIIIIIIIIAIFILCFCYYIILITLILIKIYYIFLSCTNYAFDTASINK